MDWGLNIQFRYGLVTLSERKPKKNKQTSTQTNKQTNKRFFFAGERILTASQG